MIDGIDNEHILNALCQNSYNSIIITDAQLELPGPKIVYANPTFTKLTGYSLKELIGQTPRILQGEKTDRKVLDRLKTKCQNGEPFAGKTINYAKDGTKYNVEWNISPIKNSSGKITHFISIQRNITKELQTIDTLQKIIDLQRNIIVITDGMKLVYTNQAFKDFFGVSSLEKFLAQDDCICSRFSKLEGFYYQKTDDENWIQSLQNLSSEDRIVSMEDKNFVPHGFFVGINDFGEDKDIITFTDITQSIGEKLALKHKAYHDHLSGAFNREFIHDNFDNYKEQTQTRNLKLGLIMFDIDKFKHINDTYGHNVGDRVIQKLVALTKESTRSGDYMIRWGGEEFVVLTQIKVLEQLEIIAEHIRVAIENESFDPVPLVTASFGITISLPQDSLQTLIKRADDALYRAKNTGRNKVEVATTSQ
ncbi:MAG: sensor domain-containing diguanylate cyclase [Campylobacterota bacterium]